MRNYFFSLLLFLCSAVGYAQQKPSGYYSSVLSRYEYRGWEIRKGDQVALTDGDTVTVKQIQKYEKNWSWAYYLVGKNKKGTTVYYDIASAARSGILKVPEGIDVTTRFKVVFGYLPVKDNRVEYEQISTSESSKDLLYDNALSHLARTFEKRDFRLQDKDAGHIIIPGRFTFDYGGVMDLDGWKDIEVTYLCDIQVKEGKYRIGINDFQLLLHSRNHKWESRYVFLEDISNSTKKRDVSFTSSFDGSIKGIIASLAQALDKAPDTSW